MAEVVLEGERITDWPSFHAHCRAVFGFPDFYGANMDAWIDCLTYLYEGDGMSNIVLAREESLSIQLRGTGDLAARQPEILHALVECTAFVNRRYLDAGQLPPLHLVLV